MSYGAKLSIRIMIFGIIILAISSLGTYFFSSNMLLDKDLQFGKTITDEISRNFEIILKEKVKTIRAFSLAPVLSESLDNSNRVYSKLGEIPRNKKIATLNKKWKEIDNKNDSFIQEYINNETANYFKEMQNIIKGEYGEIFLTNKYGALVASTEKLTTFAHGEKYWWKGSNFNGDGRVFFDDRGYDDSVGGYVLGIVIPITDKNEITGILKVNVNIIGSINKILFSYDNPDFGKFLLIRSGGAIVFEEGVEPLSKRVPRSITNEIAKEADTVFSFNDGHLDLVVSFSEIKITSENRNYGFGGSFESIDHKKGNIGESWMVLNYRERDKILLPLKDLIKNYVKIGLISIMFFAFGALFLGYRSVKPIKILTKKCGLISEGNFDINIDTSRSDEIGTLAKAFNKMAVDLKSSVVSRDELLREVEVRKIAELELNKLKNSLENQVSEKAKELNENISDLKRVFDAMVGRELKMKELSDRVEELEEELKKR
ncbi:MAG: HAMP domain-containing protein [Candidatus Aminicenantes bacterium]|nr:HAMP domain-containing protein [Candidatus Aminicenantes bacterium]